MAATPITRRDFQRLSAAAVTGVMAGAWAGCQQSADSTTTPTAPVSGAGNSDPTPPAAASEAASGVALMLEEPHVCRGLNTCKGLGKGGNNACAGQGACASAVAHECAGHNDCKGQGGCGGQHGSNACKGMGGCGVPLAHGWEDVRKKFEQAMADAGQQVGAAPAAN